MSDLGTFIKEVKKVNNKRHYKITNSYGVVDYLTYYRANRPRDSKYSLSTSQFCSIIRRINDLLVEEYIKTGLLPFPDSMGRLELRKVEVSPKIDKDGNVVFNAPIDWKRTLELWYNDKESKGNKVLVKTNSRTIFRTFYSKSKAIYINKCYYKFQTNRNLKIKIANLSKEGKLEAFPLYRDDYNN